MIKLVEVILAGLQILVPVCLVETALNSQHCWQKQHKPSTLNPRLYGSCDDLLGFELRGREVWLGVEGAAWS